MGKPSGLCRRDGSAAYYFRQRWPTRFKRPGTPAEIWISLGTANYSEALSRLDDARQEAQRRFRALPTGPSGVGIYSRTAKPAWPGTGCGRKLLLEDTGPLAREFFRRGLLHLDLNSSPVDADETWRADYRDELRDRCARLAACHPEEGADLAEGAAIAVLRKADMHIDPAEDAARLLKEYVRRAMVQLAAIELARFEGDFSDHVADALFRNVRGTEEGASRPRERVLGSPAGTDLENDLVDRWAAERSVAPKGVDKHRAAARWFISRAKERNVEAITKQHVLVFKDEMIRERVSPANANAKLSCLRTLLGYAVENSLLDTNPAAGVRVLDRDKDRRKRREFDVASLNAIFSSPVYSADERPTQGRGEAAYWLPIVALFTGARLEEIAQLRPSDIQLETYVDGDEREQIAWMICIKHEDGLATKNAASERRVPIHPDLEELGFVKMAQQAAAAGQRFLFPDLRPNKYGRRGAKWGEWWSRYRRDVCGISDPRMVFHSFRHLFKFYARHVGMVEGVQRQIMGHSPGDVADEYGRGRYTTYQLVQGMNSFRIPGLKLPLPPPGLRDDLCNGLHQADQQARA